MKTTQLFCLVAIVVAAASTALVESAPRSLMGLTVVTNLDPLSTYDVLEDESGRTFVRVVSHPALAKKEEEKTVFGEILKGLLKMLKGGVEGGGEIFEKVVEERKKEAKKAESKGGAASETAPAHEGKHRGHM